MRRADPLGTPSFESLHTHSRTATTLTRSTGAGSGSATSGGPTTSRSGSGRTSTSTTTCPSLTVRLLSRSERSGWPVHQMRLLVPLPCLRPIFREFRGQVLKIECSCESRKTRKKEILQLQGLFYGAPLPPLVAHPLLSPPRCRSPSSRCSRQARQRAASCQT